MYYSGEILSECSPHSSMALSGSLVVTKNRKSANTTYKYASFFYPLSEHVIQSPSVDNIATLAIYMDFCLTLSRLEFKRVQWTLIHSTRDHATVDKASLAYNTTRLLIIQWTRFV